MPAPTTTALSSFHEPALCWAKKHARQFPAGPPASLSAVSFPLRVTSPPAAERPAGGVAPFIRRLHRRLLFPGRQPRYCRTAFTRVPGPGGEWAFVFGPPDYGAADGAGAPRGPQTQHVTSAGDSLPPRGIRLRCCSV